MSHLNATYRAGDLLSDADLVLDPDLDAVGVQVTAAADLAVGQVLSLLHRLVAHAAVLLRLQLHAGHQLLEGTLLLLRRYAVIISARAYLSQAQAEACARPRSSDSRGSLRSLSR